MLEPNDETGAHDNETAVEYLRATSAMVGYDDDDDDDDVHCALDWSLRCCCKQRPTK